MQATFNLLIKEYDKDRTGYTSKDAIITINASPDTIQQLIEKLKELHDCEVA
jgi:hypothetical protein